MCKQPEKISNWKNAIFYTIWRCKAETTEGNWRESTEAAIAGDESKKELEQAKKQVQNFRQVIFLFWLHPESSVHPSDISSLSMFMSE